MNLSSHITIKNIKRGHVCILTGIMGFYCAHSIQIDDNTGFRQLLMLTVERKRKEGERKERLLSAAVTCSRLTDPLVTQPDI